MKAGDGVTYHGPNRLLDGVHGVLARTTAADHWWWRPDGREPDEEAYASAQFLTPDAPARDEKQALIRHLRRHHPNLLSGAVGRDDWRRALERDESMGFASGPLPSSGLSEVPMVVLATVHAAAHMGLFFQHDESDWVCRDYEDDPHHATRADRWEADH